MIDLEPRTEMFLRGRQFKKVIDQLYVPIREKYGLKQIEAEILFFLSHSSDATSTDIYRTLQINKGHVSQGVDGLWKKGFITMERDPNDRRYVTFELTELAQPVIRDINVSRMEMLSQLLQGVTAEEIDLLKSILEKIYRNADQMIGE